MFLFIVFAVLCAVVAALCRSAAIAERKYHQMREEADD